jgi:hypothetical protein
MTFTDYLIGLQADSHHVFSVACSAFHKKSNEKQNNILGALTGHWWMPAARNVVCAFTVRLPCAYRTQSNRCYWAFVVLTIRSQRSPVVELAYLGLLQSARLSYCTFNVWTTRVIFYNSFWTLISQLISDFRIYSDSVHASIQKWRGARRGDDIKLCMYAENADHRRQNYRS